MVVLAVVVVGGVVVAGGPLVDGANRQHARAEAPARRPGPAVGHVVLGGGAIGAGEVLHAHHVGAVEEDLESGLDGARRRVEDAIEAGLIRRLVAGAAAPIARLGRQG